MLNAKFLKTYWMQVEHVYMIGLLIYTYSTQLNNFVSSKF